MKTNKKSLNEREKLIFKINTYLDKPDADLVKKMVGRNILELLDTPIYKQCKKLATIIQKVTYEKREYLDQVSLLTFELERICEPIRRRKKNVEIRKKSRRARMLESVRLALLDDKYFEV